MESSFASRYANARDGKFQFRLRQDTLDTVEVQPSHAIHRHDDHRADTWNYLCHESVE
jgi:hypothetical protein